MKCCGKEMVYNSSVHLYICRNPSCTKTCQPERPTGIPVPKLKTVIKQITQESLTNNVPNFIVDEIEQGIKPKKITPETIFAYCISTKYAKYADNVFEIYHKISKKTLCSTCFNPDCNEEHAKRIEVKQVSSLHNDTSSHSEKI